MLEREYAKGHVTSALALVAVGASQPVVVGVGEGAHGAAAEPTEGTFFDLASLTKPIVATVAMRLDRSRQLPLETELGDLLVDLRPELRRTTVEQLLRHRAGVAPWFPLYRLGMTKRRARAWLLEQTPLGARKGTYSDLGYMIYAEAVRQGTGKPLEEVVRAELLGLPDGEQLIAGLTTRPGFSAVSCCLDNEREVELARRWKLDLTPEHGPWCGQPQDGNARFLGGCPGHAGLFGTADALRILARAWLSPRTLGPARVARALAGPRHYALGWRHATQRGSAGPALPATAIGHVGFTGGSLWLDVKRRLVMILLAHRTGVGVDLRPVRRRFHRLASVSLAG